MLFEVDPADLIDPAVEEHMLLIVVNHVCTDGWSEKVRQATSSGCIRPCRAVYCH